MKTEKLKGIAEYIKSFFKWIVIAVLIGAIGGVLGSIFHESLDFAAEIRAKNQWVIYLLPIAGIIIAAIYKPFRKKGRIDTNRVIEAVQSEDKVPLVMMPLIFISTVITQLFGGSAGREGAALQLGGSVGYNIGKLFRLNKLDTHIIIMAGMSSVFAALFGTPLTAAVFALEVICVGSMLYCGLMPCIVASAVAYKTALLLGVSPVRFENVAFGAISSELMIKTVVLAFLCAIVSIIFVVAIEKCEHFMNKVINNAYLRAFVGGLIIAGLTVILNTTDYNGAGMNIVEEAVNGAARPEAFLLKIIFTAITISAGFKGGEIVPTLFIGSTFGCVMGAVLGIDAGVGAAIGFVALFCGVVNCPLASIILAVEVFGSEALLIFALAVGVSYMMSGYFGLYKSQRIVMSKLTDEVIDIHTK